MRFLKLFYVILLLLFYTQSYGYPVEVLPNPEIKQAVLDLRHSSLSERVALDGEWEFFWNHLLSSEEDQKLKGKLVDFPFRWDNYTLDGKKLPSYGYASYKLKILLPKTQKILSLGIPEMYSAYSLFINGKKRASNGKVSDHKDSFIPHWEYQSVDLEPGQDTINLILQIANYSHSKGGAGKSIHLGTKTNIDSFRMYASAIDLFLTGCLFMGGLFFFGLYLLGGKDKAVLLFSLYSIFYSYRIIGVGNYVFHSLYPNIDWLITVRLEYICLFLSIGFFTLYTKYLYPKDIHKLAVNTISILCFSFATISLFSAPYFFTQLINPFILVMLSCIMYVPYVYLKAYKNRRPGSVFALISSLILMIIFIILILNYWHLSPPLLLLNFFCYVGLFFLQSLILSHRVSFSLKKAREEAEQGLIAKGEFLSTMSHEIRTLLNSVIGMCHLLLKEKPRRDQIENLDIMLFSANNLLNIVNDILDYSKIESGKITFEHIEMDVLSISRNIIRGLESSASDKGIELKLQYDQSINTKVYGDPTRISQVLSNLIHNAIKFTLQGRVLLNIQIAKETDKEISLHFNITDTGIGISKENQKTIFERFTQADSSTSRGFGGTGLGLAISKKILELQNSILELDSEEGKGSKFHFIQTFEKCAQSNEQQDINVFSD